MSDTVSRLNAALLGRYVVERELGEGGMATVYLAEDVKHERKVALKVLKPELAAVIGAERFLAEIKTTANLQHPHILPLHDSGEADSFLFYVMPYVEGETLRDRIQRQKQLPVDDAVAVAVAVANALHHAHERGVIHRDIKPANILMQDGEPLVADFGIALAVGAAGGSRLTETGLSVGTPYYMSPEQATGDQSIGPQSDIYALACVLYEMLTGEPPYTGTTAQAVLGRILQGAPVSATEIRKSIPANVDAAIRKALEKLPADRFTGANDFAQALKDGTFRHGAGAEGPSQDAGRWKRATLGAAAVAVLALSALGWALTRPEAPGQVLRVSMSTPEPLRQQGDFQLSEDGSLLVYLAPGETGEPQLWLRSLNDVGSSPVRGTEGAGNYFTISPDGTEVAFNVSGAVRVVPLQGGPARTLATGSLCCAHYEADGFVYFIGAERGAARVPASGGDVEVLTEIAEGENFHLVTQVLPGGRTALMQATRGTQDSEVRALDLETGEMEVLTLGHMGEYLPSGFLVVGFVNDGTVAVVPFDVNALEVTGPLVPLVEGVGGLDAFRLSFDASDSGMLLYRSGGSTSGLTPAWVDRDGSMIAIDPDWHVTVNPTNTSLALSPDGTRLAIGMPNEEGAWDLWVKTLDTGPLTRLTFDGTVNRRPVWSPDGSVITFVSDRDGASEVWERRADGSTPARKVFGYERDINEAVYSPDGEWLVFRQGSAPADIYGIRLGTDSVATPLIATDFNELEFNISPDGRWLAYTSSESGRLEVYVRPFPDVTASRLQISTEGGREPVWSRSGDELLFRDAAAQLVSVRFATGEPLRVESQEVLFSVIRFLQGNGRPQYDISSDGSRLVMLATGSVEDGGELILVNNWADEVLERLGR